MRILITGNKDTLDMLGSDIREKINGASVENTSLIPPSMLDRPAQGQSPLYEMAITVAETVLVHGALHYLFNKLESYVHSGKVTIEKEQLEELQRRLAALESDRDSASEE